MKKLLIVLTLLVILSGLSSKAAVYGQRLAPVDFHFSSFIGNYYLDRSSDGRAVLTIQEDMLVQFPPGSNSYGIKRVIPKNYQGHSVSLKLISVSDEAGQTIKYHTENDKYGNMVINFGDPAIIINGPQTYRIKYLTSDVAAFYGDKDEFLVDVNGRGWRQSFDNVGAFVHISKDFSSHIKGQPSCYIGFGDKQYPNCSVKMSQSASETLVQSSAANLSAGQALAVKLDFDKNTFAPVKQRDSLRYWLAGAAALAGLIIIFAVRKKSKT